MGVLEECLKLIGFARNVDTDRLLDLPGNRFQIRIKTSIDFLNETV